MTDNHPINTFPQLNRRNFLIGLGGAGLATGFSLFGSRILHRHPHKNASDYPPHTLRIACLHDQTSPLLSLAKEKGFLEHYGIHLVPVPMLANADAVLQSIRNNQCDLAVLSILDWLPAFLFPQTLPASPSLSGISSLPAKLMVGTTGGDFRLLVSYQRKISRVMDLTGIRIGIPRNSPKEKLFFSILLRRKGINPEMNIEWVEMDKEALSSALLSNQVQAIAGSDPFIWQILHENRKKIFELAGSNSSSWHNRINQVIGISDACLQQNPDILKSFTSALQKTALWQNANLQEAGKILADQDNLLPAPDFFKMLQEENRNLPRTTTPLWEQVAQYIDELKLLNRLPNDFKAGRTAKQICVASS